MEYLFELGDRPALRVRGLGNTPIELLGLLAGVKPVIHYWAKQVEMPYLQGLCADLGLKLLVFSQGDPGVGPARLEILIGKDPDRLRVIAQSWRQPHSNPGQALGYPSCCVEAYGRWITEVEAGKAPDIVRRIWENTDPKGTLPFFLNNVFYPYSRPREEGANERREGMRARNPALDFGLLNVISWHPCSYLCKESLRKARAIWDLMVKAAPRLAVTLRACLSRPVLFWDWSRFAVLKRKRSERREWSYTGIQPPYSLLEADLSNRIAAGNRLRVSKRGEVEILMGKRKIARFKETPPILLDFSC